MVEDVEVGAINRFYEVVVAGILIVFIFEVVIVDLVWLESKATLLRSDYFCYRILSL
jgi:hypothetical protein